MAIGKVDRGDIVVWFTADMEKTDYGVPGSPVWYEPVNIELDFVEILGVGLFPSYLPDVLVDELFNLHNDVEEWE